MPGNKVALVLSLICALIASGLVYRMMKQNAVPKVAEVPKIEVVYAKVPIPARSEITADQLEVRKIPVEAANPNTLRTIKEAVGLVTKSEIIQGEPLLKERLLEKGQKFSMSFIIPPGMRAMTIAIDEIKGVAGFVKAGERVDIVGTFELEERHVTWTIIQDAEVLALAQDMGEPVKTDKSDKDGNKVKKASAKVGTSVTLAVTPEQAQQLALAEELGVLRLTLRPLMKEDPVKLMPLPQTALLPKPPAPPRKYVPARKAPAAPQGRKIEIISGGKSHFITVD